MTRHEMRECIFCLMFQNDFYGTDEFEEQMSNFLANFHFPEEHEISEKDEKEVREKVERLIALMPDIDEKISANAKGWKIERIAKAELAILRLAVYEALYEESVPKTAQRRTAKKLPWNLQKSMAERMVLRL